MRADVFIPPILRSTYRWQEKRVKAKIHVQDDVIPGVARCKSKQTQKVFDHVGKIGGARCPFPLTKPVFLARRFTFCNAGISCFFKNANMFKLLGVAFELFERISFIQDARSVYLHWFCLAELFVVMGLQTCANRETIFSTNNHVELQSCSAFPALVVRHRMKLKQQLKNNHETRSLKHVVAKHAIQDSL